MVIIDPTSLSHKRSEPYLPRPLPPFTVAQALRLPTSLAPSLPPSLHCGTLCSMGGTQLGGTLLSGTLLGGILLGGTLLGGTLLGGTLCSMGGTLCHIMGGTLCHIMGGTFFRTLTFSVHVYRCASRLVVRHRQARPAHQSPRIPYRNEGKKKVPFHRSLPRVQVPAASKNIGTAVYGGSQG